MCVWRYCHPRICDNVRRFGPIHVTDGNFFLTFHIESCSYDQKKRANIYWNQSLCIVIAQLEAEVVCLIYN